mgnify:CR=1 FL=1
MELDTGFRPSDDGFGFANTWHDMLFGVIASRGRCGGMVMTAEELAEQVEKLASLRGIGKRQLQARRSAA